MEFGERYCNLSSEEGSDLFVRKNGIVLSPKLDYFILKIEHMRAAGDKAERC
jgi:hypothetical protein